MAGEKRPLVEFRFGHRRILARGEDTVAAALHRAGIRVLSRSVKYHRPRGYFCGTGRCTGCLMTVDGEPNVRTCQRSVEPGLQVEGQNAWPTVGLDLFGVLDRLFRRGMDYHHLLARPQALQPLLHRTVRRLSGLGKLPSTSSELPPARRMRKQVVVVGAGPGGVRAAQAAAEAGAAVLLIEADEQIGGHLLRLHPEFDCGSGREVLGELAEQSSESPGLELLLGATAFGSYASEGLAVVHRGELTLVEADRWIFAPGTGEEAIPFPNGDLPGILQEAAVRALVVRHKVRPGREAFLIGPLKRLQPLARLLESAGTEIVGTLVVEDLAPGRTESGEAPEQGGLSGFRLVGALGGRTVRAVVCEKDRERRRIPCDLVAICGAPHPQLDLFLQAGAEVQPSEGSMGEKPQVDQTFQTTVPGLYAVGEAAGCQGIEAVLLSGSCAGTAAAASLRPPSSDLVDLVQRAAMAYEQAAAKRRSPRA